MNEECLICKATLEYLEEDILMECEVCHKKEHSKTIFILTFRNSIAESISYLSNSTFSL